MPRHIHYLLFALLLAALSSPARAAESDVTARNIFALLPESIFENTPEGLSPPEKQKLLSTGLSEFWEVAGETEDVMVFASLPFRDTAVALRLFRHNTDGSVLADYMMGVATQDVADNAFGYVTSFGLVRGFNTTGAPYGEVWADGDLLYFDPATPGTWTNVKPVAPAIDVPVAVVINAGSGGSGSVFVRMTIAEALSRLQDVYINGTGTPLAGQVLIYDAAQQRWENHFLTPGANISITNASGSITIAVTGLGTMAFENTGASGSFTAASGEVITVVNGVITSIV